MVARAAVVRAAVVRAAARAVGARAVATVGMARAARTACRTCTSSLRSTRNSCRRSACSCRRRTPCSTWWSRSCNPRGTSHGSRRSPTSTGRHARSTGRRLSGGTCTHCSPLGNPFARTAATVVGARAVARAAAEQSMRSSRRGTSPSRCHSLRACNARPSGKGRPHCHCRRRWSQCTGSHRPRSSYCQGCTLARCSGMHRSLPSPARPAGQTGVATRVR